MGHTLVCMDSWDAEQSLALVERYRVTNTHMVPTHFKRMLSLPEEIRKRYDVSSMKWLIHAAAPCPVGIKRAMLDWWGPCVYEYYAATEGGGTIVTPEDWLARPGTVGIPWPVSEVMIADDDGNECPPGTPGTVYMKAPAPRPVLGQPRHLDLNSLTDAAGPVRRRPPFGEHPCSRRGRAPRSGGPWRAGRAARRRS